MVTLDNRYPFDLVLELLDLDFKPTNLDIFRFGDFLDFLLYVHCGGYGGQIDEPWRLGALEEQVLVIFGQFVLQ